MAKDKSDEEMEVKGPDVVALVSMAKEMVELQVHPTCVKNHQDLGWVVVSGTN